MPVFSRSFSFIEKRKSFGAKLIFAFYGCFRECKTGMSASEYSSQVQQTEGINPPAGWRCYNPVNHY
jgi:hypothetical protein